MAVRKPRTNKALKDCTVVREATSNANVPPELHLSAETLIGLSNKELRTWRDRVKHEMRIGAPPVPFHYWKALCDLDVKLHLESINRQSYGTKVRPLKYSK